nr:OCIA domain containing protein 1 [Hymenolepis microstoma]
MEPGQPPPPELTMEDIATFKRCRQESFWRGSVPMIIGANLLVGIAHSRGFFSSRRRLLFPTYFLAGVVGYIGGKVSYMSTCKSMFLQLHDSRVKDFLLGQTDRLPLPSRPEIVEGYNCPVTNRLPQERPTTYAQRRQYFRQQQMAGTPDSPQQPFPIPAQGNNQEISQFDQPEESQSSWLQPPISKAPQSQQQSSSSDYFDNQRPLSSFFQDEDYKPRD